MSKHTVNTDQQRHIQYNTDVQPEQWQYFIGDVFDTGDLKNDKYPLVDDEPKYDPSIHLNIVEPEFVVLLNNNFQRVKHAPAIDFEQGVYKSQVAYTAPFRILSDEGYKVLKSIIKREFINCEGDQRQPNRIRHIGYRSKWIRDFNRCPIVLEFLTKLCGSNEPLMATTLKSSYSHTNIGLVDPTKNIDQWHVDSVPYVIIILACDMTNTIGGELQLIEREKQEALKLIAEYNGEIPDEYVQNIDFGGAGSVIFMQGCEIAHRVKPVLAGTEPRLTVVNSYMSRNPFVTEKTRYNTFVYEPTCDYEFTLHKAWRAREQLKALMMYDKDWPSKENLIKRLNLVINELVDCRDLLNGTATDAIGFYDAKKKGMSAYDDTNFKVEKKVVNIQETGM
ncbi:unnamed protein product [Didymodactylos carnosus]|uniref:Uncharacterized protein n=1 Tax=Didymodactylos carnosus TaxID=1234261 RepID=A0A815XEG1_9BILA|nr:unnamed protein product [Didymodactylos carnosus]CAF1556577.1 unnamed protein product [Didymodactylos carnosus]CAF4242810.1 unnamed protein product [Didymodactylos carnosus]CAF4417753.1 unnamed protein product [Didymodactylos carnosus]